MTDTVKTAYGAHDQPEHNIRSGFDVEPTPHTQAPHPWDYNEPQPDTHIGGSA